jgi:hypothetical protein
MPHGDGTGPSGLGPMTGRAKGRCIIKIPDSHAEPVEGFVGLNARYVVLSSRSGRIWLPWRDKGLPERKEMD